MWLVAGGVLGIAEVLTADLTLASLGIAALSAGVVGMVGGGALAQALTFAMVAALTLGVLRPYALRNLRRRSPKYATNVDLLIGATAATLIEVSEQAGRIKLNGEVWSARTRAGVIPTGSRVRVVAIAGATAIVEATEE
jgi:membrane protein implicated in regulation of membrane protease activity